MTQKQVEARECALKDINEELAKQKRGFIGFIHSLDPVMEELVDIYEDQQDIITPHKRSFCGLAISTKHK